MVSSPPPHRTALVTGGALRIGRAIVDDLAAHGWGVAIHCRAARAEADALAASISANGGRAAVVQAELSDLAGLPLALKHASAALGPIDLLVNSAAMFEEDAIGRLDPGAWNRQITVNLTAPVFLAQAFAAALPAGADGNIVNIIDQRVWKPVPAFFSYQISKSALWTATRTMAQALAPRIRVNAIGPGPVLPSSRQTQADMDRQVATLPLRRSPALAEFGRTVRYLVETPSITGQMIALDGGQHLAWETPDVVGTRE
ncbi:MAG: SDR family oxidoreductase [Bauldia sp.]|nr:SDR family oxidoreductase [Bauldia sp.]